MSGCLGACERRIQLQKRLKADTGGRSLAAGGAAALVPGAALDWGEELAPAAVALLTGNGCRSVDLLP